MFGVGMDECGNSIKQYFPTHFIAGIDFVPQVILLVIRYVIYLN